MDSRIFSMLPMQKASFVHLPPKMSKILFWKTFHYICLYVQIKSYPPSQILKILQVGAMFPLPKNWLSHVIVSINNKDIFIGTYGETGEEKAVQLMQFIDETKI